MAIYYSSNSFFIYMIGFVSIENCLQPIKIIPLINIISVIIIKSFILGEKFINNTLNTLNDKRERNFLKGSQVQPKDILATLFKKAILQFHQKYPSEAHESSKSS